MNYNRGITRRHYADVATLEASVTVPKEWKYAESEEILDINRGVGTWARFARNGLYPVGSNTKALEIDASGHTVLASGKNLTVPGTLSVGGTSLAISSGSFTVTATGFTASITGTAYWQKINTFVTIFIPALSGTSNATTFTLTGIPAEIQNSASTVKNVLIEDGSGETWGTITVVSGSIWGVHKESTLSTSWTASGYKSLSATTFSYYD
jgi:hypothetical protein